VHGSREKERTWPTLTYAAAKSAPTNV